MGPLRKKPKPPGYAALNLSSDTLRGLICSVAIYLTLASTLSGCATVSNNDAAVTRPPPCPTTSTSVSAAPRWLLRQSAAALHATGSFFIGMGNVGLQVTAGSEVHSGSGSQLGVYLGITLVAAGSIGIGNLFVNGGEHLATFAADIPTPRADTSSCIPAS